MNGTYPVVGRSRALAVRSLALTCAAVGLAALAAGAAVVLHRYPPPLLPAVTAAVALLAILALALARYDSAIVLGFLLFGIVRLEPAPTDAVFAVVIAVALVTGRFNLQRVPLTATGLVVIFLALNLVSSTAIFDAGIAFRFFLITLYLSAFSLWLAGYVRSADRARLVVRAYLVGAVVCSVLATLALFVPYPGHDALLLYGDRARGFFKDANVFGPFLVVIALVLIEEIVAPRLLKASRWTKVVLLLLLAMGILFSYSRAAWLNFAIGFFVIVVVLALRPRGGRKAIAVLSMALVIPVVLTATIAVTGSVSFLEKRARFQTYDVQRFGTQAEGIELARQHPFGVGPGQFEVLEIRSAHSTYVRAFAEQGFLGLLTIVALLLVTLGLAAGNALQGRDTYGIGSAALLAAWCGLLANSAFVDTLHWRHLWFLAALIWAGAMRRGGSPAAPRPSSWPNGTS